MRARSAIALCVLVLNARPAAAQPPADGDPSPELERALRAYAAERYGEAVPLLEASATGRRPEATNQRQRADLYLGRALYHLHRYGEALDAFARIASAGRAHLHYDQVFHWLIELHERLPPAAEPRLVAAIGHYPDAFLERYRGQTNDRDRLATADYLRGRAHYDAGRYYDALRLFRAVPDDTRVGGAARTWHRRTLATVGPQ